MDWGNDYFTFSDTNIEYIWRFLKLVHENGLALPRPPLDRVVPALRHVALPARALASGATRTGPTRRSSSASRCSTASRVARDLDDDALDAARERRRRREAGRGLRAARERRVGRRARYPDEPFDERKRGEELVGWRYAGAVRRARAGPAVEHRVIPWDEVSLEEGTGIVHIAPGCGPGGLRALARPRPAGPDAGRRGRPLLRRLRLAARPLDGRGRRPDHRPARGKRAARRVRPLRAPLPRTAGAATRR